MTINVTEDQLKEASGQINPAMVGRDAESIIAYQEGISGSADDCMGEAKRLQDLLIQATHQARQDDGSLDYDKVTVFSGAKQEKQEKIIEINSRLHGTHKALSEHRRIAGEKAEAEKIAAANGIDQIPGDGPIMMQNGKIVPVQTMVPRTIEMSARAEASLQKVHGSMKIGDADFAQIARSPGLELEIPVGAKPGQQIYAADFNTTSWDSNRMYEPGFLPARTQTIMILPHIYSGPMPAKNMSYWEETTQTSTAAGRAEGAKAAESTYAMTMRTYIPVSVAHYLPLTEEALEDRGELMEYIDYIMPLGINQKLDTEVGGGTGAANSLRGLTRVGYGKTDPQPMRHKYLAATEKWDVLLDAKLLAMEFGGGILGMQVPDTAFVTAKFWGDCLKSKSSAGGYYVGGPDQAMFAMPWGMNLVVVTHSFSDVASKDGGAVADIRNYNMAGVVMDTSPIFSKLCYRHGIRVRFGMVNDDFIKFKLAVRAEVRCQFVVKRAMAICQMINPKADGTAPADRTG